MGPKTCETYFEVNLYLRRESGSDNHSYIVYCYLKYCNKNIHTLALIKLKLSEQLSWLLNFENVSHSPETSDSCDTKI